MSYQMKTVHWAIVMIVLVISIAFAGCTGYQPSPGPATTPQTQVPGSNTVTIQNFAFNPPALSIAPGTTVTWINKDALDHEVISDASISNAEGGIFRSPVIPKDGSYSFTFTNQGTYPYHCSIHPSMKGTITVQ
jgi:amicyanin